MSSQNGLFFIKNHSRLFVGSVILILLAIIPLLMLSLSSKNNSFNKNLDKTIKPTPTSGVTSSYFVGDISPASDATSVSVFEPISVSFTEPVPSSEKQSISLEASPTIDGTTAWSKDNNLFTLTPRAPLLSNTTYTITIRLGSVYSSWKFQTVTDKAMSKEDQQRAKNLVNEDYKQREAEMDQMYPWRNKLPLQTDTSFIYFDVEKKAFVAKLYPKKSTTTSVDNQIKDMQSQIISSLSGLGIPTTGYPFIWEVTPEP